MSQEYKMSMEKEPIKTIQYDRVKFKYVSSHYDIHLNGTCIYEGSLCEFKCELPGYDEEKDEWEEAYAKIYKLDYKEKLKWLWRQWLFEKCIIIR